MTMERRAIDPGLLPAFRFLIGLRMALILLALVLQKAGAAPEVLAVIEVVELPGRQALAPFDLAVSAILVGYLSWHGLERRLGRAYLPLALASVTLTLVLISAAAVAAEAANDPNGVSAVRRASRLVFQLSVPLILTAWQYGFSGALTFSLLTTAFEVAVTQATISLGGRAGFLVATMSIGRIALFVLIGYLVNRLAASLRLQRRALAEANLELGRYAAALDELATSRERNRLARELHDTLAHSLSALAVQLEGLRAVWDTNAADARAMLDQSLGTARQGLVEARRAIRELRASPLEGLGLTLAVRQLAESAAERARLELNLTAPDRLDLRPEVEQGLYRIAEEALANIGRHAGARRVSMRLERVGENVRLSVSDDGHGFDPGSAESDEHFGLRGMRERARLIGGTFSVDSRPGAGTTVQVTVDGRR